MRIRDALDRDLAECAKIKRRCTAAPDVIMLDFSNLRDKTKLSRLNCTKGNRRYSREFFQMKY